jgi:hypothetical protein
METLETRLSEQSHISGYNEKCDCINLYTNISSTSELVMRWKKY